MDKRNGFDLRPELPRNLVLPVSGQGMVEQLGIMLTLSSLGYRPEVCLGSSGGALVSAIGTICSWNPAEIGAIVSGFKTFDIMKMRTFGPLEGLARQSFFTPGSDLGNDF